MQSKRRNGLLFVLVLALLLGFLPRTAAAEGEVLLNSSFGQGLAAWSKNSWIAGGAKIHAEDGMVSISSEQMNDARLKQKVKLASSQSYHVTAQARIVTALEQDAESTGRAWIGFDDRGAKAYLDDANPDWQDLSLYVAGPEGGGEVTLCLAMGDYGNLVSGEVEFRDVSMMMTSDTEGQNVVQLASATKSKDANENPTLLAVSRVLCKALFAALVIAVILLVAQWARRCKWILPQKWEIKMAIALLVLAALVRFAMLMMTQGYTNDTQTFVAWAQRFNTVGPSQFYATDYFCDYPPGMLYLLGLGYRIGSLFGIEVFVSGIGLAIMFLPVILIDIALAAMVWRYARKKLGQMPAIGILIVMAFQPVLLYDLGIWHQVDAVLCFFLAATFILLDKDKKIWAAAVYGLAILIKPQALMLGPVFALPYLADLFNKEKKTSRAVANILLGIVTAFAVIFVLSAPFTGGQPFWPFWNRQGGNWLFHKYFDTATSYPYATVNADNVYMLFNGNFMPEETYLGPLRFSTWSMIGLFAVLIATFAFYIIAKKKHKMDTTFLLAAFLVAGLFLVGPRMHERYSVPIIVFLILAYAKIKDRSLMTLFAMFSGGIFANMALALYALNDMSVYQLSPFIWANRIVALYMLLCFIYLTMICIDICIHGNIQGIDTYDDPQPKQGMLQRFAGDRNRNIQSNREIQQNEKPKTDPQNAESKAMKQKENSTFKTAKWLPLRWERRKRDTGPTVMMLEDRFRPRSYKMRWKRWEMIFIIALTLIYGFLAFFRLGTTNVPETYWRGQDGEKLLVSFDEPVSIAQVWSYGGISNGTLDITVPEADVLAAQNESAEAEGTKIVEISEPELDATEQEAEEGSVSGNATSEALTSIASIPAKYDVMYRWTITDCVTESQNFYLEAQGETWLEALFFIDADGNLVEPSSVTNLAGTPINDPDSSPEHLFDEVGSKPVRPDVLNGMYFDELYHGRTAYEHLHGLKPYENTHPPLGKIFIMIGVAIFGMNPFGWRCVGTLFGVAMVPIFFMLAKRLLKNGKWAAFATVLFTFDFMHFVQTRIATIDVYGVFFILLMYYFMLEYWRMNFYRDGIKKTLKPLALSGLFFALGAASKWIDIYAGVGLAILFFFSIGQRFSEFVLARSAQKRGEPGAEIMVKKTECFYSNLMTTLSLCVIMFIAVPMLVYVASYIPYFLVKDNPYTIGDVPEIQSNMFKYHAQLVARHPYESDWWTWPLDIRPIFYYQSRTLPEGMGGVISSFGNPIVWWTGLIGLVGLIVHSIAKKRMDNTTLFLLVGFGAQFLPWSLITRATFIYHYFASVPFIILAFALLMKRWYARWKGAKWVAIAVVVLALIVFALYYPALSGLPVSRAYLNKLRIFPTWTW